MLAARNGHLEATEMLLKHGADARMVNKSAQSSLDVACFWNHHQVADRIRSFLKPIVQNQLEVVNYFSQSAINRQSYMRSDKDLIKDRMTSSKARFLVYGELQLLIRKLQDDSSKEVIFKTWNEIQHLVSGENKLENDVIFLGIGDLARGKLMREGHLDDEDEERSFFYFAVNFKRIPTDAELARLGGDYAGRGVLGVRDIESGIVAQSRSVLAWHDSYTYCPACGSSTEIAEAGWKRVCKTDGCKTKKGAHNACFPRTDPVVIMLILSKDKQRCLLGRQGRHPPRMYSSIAGFLEPGENIEDGARREAMEEVGIKIGKIEYHSSQPWPFPSSLMIGLIGHAIDDNFECDHVELEDARWFDKSEVSAAYIEGMNRREGLLIPPPYAIANKLIKSWIQMTPNL